jgi:hypothetical protein
MGTWVQIPLFSTGKSLGEVLKSFTRMHSQKKKRTKPEKVNPATDFHPFTSSCGDPDGCQGHRSGTEFPACSKGERGLGQQQQGQEMGMGMGMEKQLQRVHRSRGHHLLEPRSLERRSRGLGGWGEGGWVQEAWEETEWPSPSTGEQPTVPLHMKKRRIQVKSMLSCERRRCTCFPQKRKGNERKIKREPRLFCRTLRSQTLSPSKTSTWVKLTEQVCRRCERRVHGTC